MRRRRGLVALCVAACAAAVAAGTVATPNLSLYNASGALFLSGESCLTPLAGIPPGTARMDTLTMEAWVRTAVDLESSLDIVVSSLHDVDPVSFEVLQSLAVARDDGVGPVLVAAHMTASQTFPTEFASEPLHFAVSYQRVFDDQFSVVAYVNGSASSADLVTLPPLDSFARSWIWSIGCKISRSVGNLVSANFFHGVLDNVRFWSARFPSDLVHARMLEATVDPGTPDLFFNMHMDNITTDTVYGDSPLGHNVIVAAIPDASVGSAEAILTESLAATMPAFEPTDYVHSVVMDPADSAVAGAGTGDLVLTAHDRLVLFGGCASAADNTYHEFSLATASWSVLWDGGDTTGPSARCGAASFVSGGRLYIVGGALRTSAGFEPRLDAWALDLATTEWQQLSPLRNSTEMNQQVYHMEGRFIGILGENLALSAPSTRAFEYRANRPFPLSGADSVIPGPGEIFVDQLFVSGPAPSLVAPSSVRANYADVLVFSGFSYPDLAPSRSVYRFNLASLEWSLARTLTQRVPVGAAALVAGAKIVLVGGGFGTAASGPPAAELDLEPSSAVYEFSRFDNDDDDDSDVHIAATGAVPGALADRPVVHSTVLGSRMYVVFKGGAVTAFDMEGCSPAACSLSGGSCHAGVCVCFQKTSGHSSQIGDSCSNPVQLQSPAPIAGAQDPGASRSGSLSIDTVLFAVVVATAGVLVLLAVVVLRYRRLRQTNATIQNALFQAIEFEDIKLGPCIGQGGFGSVYKGWWRGAVVAVKIVSERGLTPERMARFTDEIGVMVELRHPKILLYMAACLGPKLALVSEFMERGSLYDLIHDSDIRLTAHLCYRFAIDTCKGMLFLHQSTPPILHRDLKSPNLLVDERWNLKVGDFGLSAIKGDSPTGIEGGASVFWTAPEVLAGGKSTEAADIYSFGIVLWEIFTRSELYQDLHPVAVARLVIEGTRPDFPAEFPPNLVGLVELAWSAKPDVRPPFDSLAATLAAESVALHGSAIDNSINMSGLSTMSASPAAPTGRVCMAATVVEEADLLWELEPGDMLVALDTYSRICRELMEHNDGYEVSSASDSFLVAFSTCSAAVSWAVQVQCALQSAQWPESIQAGYQQAKDDPVSESSWAVFPGLRVQIGVHFGRVKTHTSSLSLGIEYSGNTVNRTRHLTAMANGGQILATGDVYNGLVADSTVQHDAPDMPAQSHPNPPLLDTAPQFLLESLTQASTSSSERLYMVNVDVLGRRRFSRREESLTASAMFDELIKTDNLPGEVPLAASHTPNRDILRSKTLGKRVDLGSSLFVSSEHISMERPLNAAANSNTNSAVFASGAVGMATTVASMQGRQVVVKRLARKNRADVVIRQLKAEASIMSKLRHPNIVSIFGLILEPELHAIVSPFIEGGSLTQAIESRPEFVHANMVRFATDMAAGMAFLHAQLPPILHTSLTSNNVLLGPGDTALICDFGFLRLKQESRTVSQLPKSVGAAVEVLQGASHTTASDVYSFGAVLWMMTTPERDSDMDDQLAVAGRMISGWRPTIGTAPKGYAALVARCWAEDPAQRPTFEAIKGML